MKHLARALALFLWAVVASAQAPQAPPPQDPPQPTFRTTVDLVPVDVNIIDDSGRPIPDLKAADFVLKVDGKPRRVASVQYVPSVRDVDTSVPLPTHYSSNETSRGGRLIMFAVDQGNIGVGRGRVALEAASRFIAQLSPADRVGLATLPGAGPQIDFTEHHALVRTALSKLSGQESGYQAVYRIGMAEAAEIQRGNQLVYSEVVNRECAGLRGLELEICRRQISTDSMTMHALARERARNSLMALRRLFDRMALTPSQKTIIYFSEGLVVDREIGDVSWIADAAARAQVVLYVIQLDTPAFDVTVSRLSPTATQDRILIEEGLGMLAGLTRGALMRVIGSAEPVFKRLSLELAGYYLLSFEPEPEDRDGRRHKISVSVPTREGVSVRARTEFVVGEARARSADALLSETMSAPLLASEIPLKLSTYTLRDPSQNKPRILFATEIDRSGNANERLSLAYALLDAKGTVVSSQIVRDVAAPIQPASRIQTFAAPMPADADGMYTLKLAVVDERGRRGSVEHTFRAQLATAGQIRVTDLLIGEPTSMAEGGLRPVVASDVVSDMLQGYVELYSDAEDVLQRATVALEVASDEQGRTLDVANALIQTPSQDNPKRRTAQAIVPIALLPPGEYVARAIVSVDGTKAGQVTRPFRIAKARAATENGTLGARPGSRPPIPFISRPEAFERSSVLSPAVVQFFMERMNFGPAGAAGAATAIEHARGGRFEEAIAALASAENRQLATTFLTGLSLYAKGDLEGANVKFRESLKQDSEFFPAAFYLGACYAAGGKDKQAVGAWQTSLVTESDAPFIYTLLADAFLRLRQIDSALGILNEARTLWPDSDQVQLRIGTALALGGQTAEALRILEPYLARNPNDHERHFVVLRALYEARQRGTSIRSVKEDQELFERHAASYQAAGGPQAALVDEWRKVVMVK
jgi:VWFA-related protein